MSRAAFLVPTKTPPAIVDKIRADTIAALAVPSVKDKLEQNGAVIMGSTSAELVTFLASEVDKWGHVIHAANIRPQ